jgi:acyl transferase domain-containing protein
MAVVAATCILPGAPDIDELWRAFDKETTAIGTAPPQWMNRAAYYDPDRRARNRSFSETVALMPAWEPTRPLRLPPRQAARLDPTHRLAIEVAQRVVDSLEHTWLPRETTGVWVANVSGALTTLLTMVAYHGSEKWTRKAAAVRPDLASAIRRHHASFQERYPYPREEGAASGNILAGRIANYFDFRGSQMAVDAACASSMAALRNACLSLEDGRCDMAMVASIGVQLAEMMVIVAKARAISAGPSFPFDRDASGYVPGEGGIMVALTREEDARRRGLPILGIIRSIGSSVGGRGSAPWSPSEAAETLAIRQAWAEGELSPAEAIDYIEAHGTATQVGDATEHAAMLATYGGTARAHAIPFGSVKSMVGHTVESAGLAGLLRALYVFDRERIPPTVGVREPAEYVLKHAERLRLAVHGEPLPPRPGPRRVAVSSFGVGGINFHAILESGTPAGTETPAESGPAVRAYREPIAIVGAAGIMPQADDAEAVWRHLVDGVSVHNPLSDYIPDFASYYDSRTSRRDRTVCQVSAIVDPPQLREPARWRILPRRAGRMFRDHLLLLNAASQLVAAGSIPSDPGVRERSGVFVGDLLDSDSRNELLRVLVFQRWFTELRACLADVASPQELGELEREMYGDPDLALRDVTEDDSMSGQGSLNASRVASGLDLRGSAVTVNSACASGLTALTVAIQELRSGSLDFALVGGASLAVDETNQVLLSAIGTLSPSGQGRPYAKDADGFVIGTGAAWFALKRLTDAERDGDDILAVVRECVGTSDGKGRSVLAPNVQGRREVIRRAYGLSGIDPRTVQYIEGHGAGSALGDASELEVIASEMAAGGQQVGVGSVKGNYGHLKGAAAFAALLKVVLCLRNGKLVPTPGISAPADLADERIWLVDKAAGWPENHGQPRRAGINAFGLGGANYHAIIDEYRKPRAGNGARQADGAAAGPAAFRVAAARPQDLADRLRAGTPGTGGDWRAAVLAPAEKVARVQRGILAARITEQAALCPGEVSQAGIWSGPDLHTGPLVLLFPGQAGTQFFDAVAWLATGLPTGQAVQRHLEEILGEPGRVLSEALASGNVADLGELRARSGTSQVLGLVASYLAWRWLTDRTDVPAVALGHSVGEFAALVAAGSLSLESAIHLCWERGRLAEEAAHGTQGGMAAVFAAPDQVRLLTDAIPDVFLATVNGPRMCVIAGWAIAVEQALARAEAAGIEFSRLDIGLPFHTPLLAGAVPGLRALLDRTAVAPPRLPVYSAVRSGLHDSDPDGIRDAIARLYVEPVRLDQLISQAARAGARRFAECGVGRSLSRSVDAVLPATPHLALPGVSSGTDGLTWLDAGLWVAGLTDRPTQRPSFGLFTPVAVAAQPPPGQSWRGASVVVAVPRPGPLAARLARELSSELSRAGAIVEVVPVRELAGKEPGPASRPAADLARPAPGASGPSWLIWLSAGDGVAPASGLDSARTMAELTCLRTVAGSLGESWLRHGDGGLVVVTWMDGRLGETRALLDPAGGALAGFSRAFAKEYPAASTVFLDIGPDIGGLATAARITALGRPAAGYHELGMDAAGYWTTELAPLPDDDGSHAGGSGVLDALRDPEGAVLVSGGTTGIVGHMICVEAERLTGPLPGRLILMSRTPAASADAAEADQADAKRAHLFAWRHEHPGQSLHEFERSWRRRSRAIETRGTLARLAAAGVQAEHHLIDVCDMRSVRALGERLRLDGMTVRTVVHGAGIERSARITEKPPGEWAATAAVKISGFQALVDAAGDGLKLVVAHGSVSGSLGLLGQTDYAAGNEYLAQATARLRAERPEITAQYIGWPAWNAVGMAADPEVKRRLEGMGLRYLDPGEGARWGSAIVARAAALPARTVVLPVPLPAGLTAGCSGRPAPAQPWWLIDTVTWQERTATVRRLYDLGDPRDRELGDHRVRGNARIAGVQIVEQLAEAFMATAPGAPATLELRDIRLHQGLVLATTGRRPSAVTVCYADDGSAQLRLQTSALLRGGLPGSVPVLVASAAARATGERRPRPVDTGLAWPVTGAPDLAELAGQAGIGYAGRFAVSGTALHHPGYDAACRFTVPAPPGRSGRHLIDPPVLDLAIRAVGLTRPAEPGEGGLPSAIERCVLYPDPDPDEPAGDHLAFVTVRPHRGYDILLTDSSGRVLVSVSGLRLSLPADSASQHPGQKRK